MNIGNQTGINYSANFGQNMPVKKTYRAMQKYYETVNDKAQAKIYKSLDNQAKARLHNNKIGKAEDEIFDFSEKLADESFSFKERLQNGLTYLKLAGKVVKEYVLSKFYSLRA